MLFIVPMGIEQMPDNKKLEAYQMAEQMDEQQKEYQREMERDKLDRFLQTIGQIESSGGKNFDHQEIESGMHEGHRAAGTYGLMPNTVYEVLNRMRLEGPMQKQYSDLRQMEPDAVKQYIESNPEVEQKLAERLARRVLKNQGGDEEKAAYSWFQGHNLSPKDIEQRKYQEHDYVNKYKKYRGE